MALSPSKVCGILSDLRLLFLGDIFGAPGRQAVRDYLPLLKDRLQPDLIIANIENSAHGFGVTSKIYHELKSYGVEVMTSGNHMWDNVDILTIIQDADCLVRPINFPVHHPGVGYRDIEVAGHGTVRIINALGSLFMHPVSSAMPLLEEVIPQSSPRDAEFAAIFVDFHAEASSEKMATANAFDGRISALIGTHTHVPTADCRILPNGTAYQTDSGMCGDYDSVIGMKTENAVARLQDKLPKAKLQPATGDGMIAGAFITIDPYGLAQSIEPVRYGPGLAEHLPNVRESS